MKFISNPTITSNPNPLAPLAMVVEFATDVPSRATLDITGGSRTWQVSSDNAQQAEHRLPVVGMRPGDTCTVSVTAEDVDGNLIEAGAPVSFTAAPLPDDFPPFEVTTCVPEKREPGVLLFNIRYSPAGEDLPGLGLIAAVDGNGEIVWFYRTDEAIGDVRRLSNGNILYVGDGLITEIDLLGETKARWYATGRWQDRTPPADAVPVATGMFHHAAIELPSGNILACSMEIRDIPGFPTTEDDPDGGTETASVVGDVIVEFTRDGATINEYRLLDLLDPHRVCYGSRAAYWVRRGFPGTCDWSHVNGLTYDAEDGIIASVRHQDCLIRIDRASGELDWLLGTHANWRKPWSDHLLTPANGLEWQYHQHDCSVTQAGTIMCFDNGNHRATPFEPKMAEADCYSRAVEFAVDSHARTVRQIWARGRQEDGTYSTYQSGAVRLPETGNTFINYGGVCTLDGIPSGQINTGHCHARLIEVTSGSPGETVFEMIVNDRASNAPTPLSSFRAEHYPNFGVGGS